MMEAVKPPSVEIHAALKAFESVVMRTTSVFKIGRCDDDGFASLSSREMYLGHERITSLWKGAGGQAMWVENALTTLAMQQCRARCRNEKVGGGPIGSSSTHHVYIVEWEATPDLLAEVAYLWLQRELPELRAEYEQMLKK